MGKVLIFIILIAIIIGVSLEIAILLKQERNILKYEYYELKEDKKEQIMLNEPKKDFTNKIEDIDITVVYDNNPYKEGLETGWGF